LSQQVQSLQKEKERLKSENLMLRRVDKDRRTGENEEAKRLQDENLELQQQLEIIDLDRKKEAEVWETERATLREMID
jgi:hypothetical protein